MAGFEGGRPYRLGAGVIDSVTGDLNTWMTPNNVTDIETMNVVMTRVCGLMSLDLAIQVLIVSCNIPRTQVHISK